MGSFGKTTPVRAESVVSKKSSIKLFLLMHGTISSWWVNITARYDYLVFRVNSVQIVYKDKLTQKYAVRAYVRR